MRFLRGLGVAVVGFVIWIIASFLGAFECIANSNGFGTPVSCGISNMSPLFSIPLVLGFLAIFLGPIYYWIIEPIARPEKANQKRISHGPINTNYQPSYQQPPSQSSYQQPTNQPSYQQPPNQP